ncbi:transcriptional regulator [Actinacidiphila acididurans]|uniref:Transcriptional regulator n=1 Tax=Actinacidiphila acididurans TaxID=2784346 RepID=A0ABS2U3L5_9ACTN|nr:transcriptional regulator [Actinacidiphila acididurans]MBM9510197.1 transcriptional regulator [Actinacidiphila acididurans]
MAARRIVGREPNERLQALIEEANCSNVGLARRVNMRGAERGLDLRYDKTSVSRWLRGQQPRGMTPFIITEVLSDKLGRLVSIEEIGMTGGRRHQLSATGLAFIPDFRRAVEHACDLWQSDAARRNFLTGSGVLVSALLGPSRDWLIAEPDTEVSHSGENRVSRADTELLGQATQNLADLDHRYGSGNVRPVAVHCLNSVATTLLRGSYDEADGRRLYAAAARLSELVGYMALDDGRAGLAQRYYIQALRLSQAAGDRGFGGYIMAVGMGHLAAVAGFPREVTQLARVALEGTRGRITPAVQACLYAAEARGHALTGDGPAYELAAGRAVEALERSDPAQEPDWITRFDRAYLADELAHCCVDLHRHQPAVRRAEEALAGHPAHRVRRRTIDLLLLATAHAQAHRMEEACGAAKQALPLLTGLRSHLGLRYLRNFQERLLPFVREASVRDFHDSLEASGVLTA